LNWAIELVELRSPRYGGKPETGANRARTLLVLLSFTFA
jgi:hypothetical protein